MGFLSSFGTNLGATVGECRRCFCRRARQGSSESGQFQGRDHADGPCPPTRACGPEGRELRKTWQGKPNQGAKETTAIESYPRTRFRSKHKTDAFRTRLGSDQSLLTCGHKAFLFLSPRELHNARLGTRDEHQPERCAIDAHGPDAARQQQTTGYGESHNACGEVKQQSHGYWHEKSAKREKESFTQRPISYIMLTKKWARRCALPRS